MNKSTKFSSEVRERAVRMVQEHRGEYPWLWAAVESMAPKIGCVPQTLLGCGHAATFPSCQPPAHALTRGCIAGRGTHRVEKGD